MGIFKRILFRSMDCSSLKAALDYNEIRIKKIENSADDKTDLDKDIKYKSAQKLRKALHEQLEKKMLELERFL